MKLDLRLLKESFFPHNILNIPLMGRKVPCMWELFHWGGAPQPATLTSNQTELISASINQTLAMLALTYKTKEQIIHYYTLFMGIYFGPKHTWVKTGLGQNILDQNSIGSKLHWVKTPLGQNSFGSKLLWVKILGSKRFGWKHFGSKHLLPIDLSPACQNV